MQNLSEVSQLLVRTLAELDIPEQLADEAVLEFQRVAVWLGEENSALAEYNPSLYPQGSFRLGTPVRPILKGDEFDIDLVCRLEIEKDKVTQAELKKMVGDRLSANADLRTKLKESRRCWTLTYKPKFHLDVLPSIPDMERSDTGILLTDTDLVRWQFSNPIGYANWFYDRMRPVLLESRDAFAKRAGINVEEVPEWRIRTPLQRAVQLLKRDRDIRFSKDPDARPISIIITTLAGRAYRHQRDLATALIEMVEEMPRHIEKREDKWWVVNPAHPNENFADKWNEKPERRDAFLRWLTAVQQDVQRLVNAASTRDATLQLESQLSTKRSTTAPMVLGEALAPAVDNAEHAQMPPWPSTLKHQCSIDVDIHRSIRGPRLWGLDRYTHKGVGIHFRARTDTPPPYDVKWQIINTGPEARRVGDLRGGFNSGEGPYGTEKWERARYGGTHFVEAFVVKNGILVARSGRIHVRIAR